MISDERIEEIENLTGHPSTFTAIRELLAERKQLVVIAEYAEILEDQLRSSGLKYTPDRFRELYEAWRQGEEQ